MRPHHRWIQVVSLPLCTLTSNLFFLFFPDSLVYMLLIVHA